MFSHRSSWAIPLPSSLTAQCAAKIGTAGYTAMLCVQVIRPILCLTFEQNLQFTSWTDTDSAERGTINYKNKKPFKNCVIHISTIDIFKAIQANGVKPEDGVVLVTGATGGVGSVSILLLSQLGYNVGW